MPSAVQNVDLYMTFADLTKVISSLGVHQSLAKVEQLYDGMLARMQNDGEFSEPFLVTNGIKQGSALAPTFLTFSTRLTECKSELWLWYSISNTVLMASYST